MADNSMWFNFYISTKYTFDIDKMLNIFEKLIEKLNLTYNYEYMIFSKTYWKKGWMKSDELLKHKGSISEIDKDILLQIKDKALPYVKWVDDNNYKIWGTPLYNENFTKGDFDLYIKPLID